MRYYSTDKKVSCITSRRLPVDFGRHRIRNGKVYYGHGAWGTYVSQSVLFNGFGFEYNLCNIKNEISLSCDYRRSLVGLCYLLKGKVTLQEQISQLRLSSGLYYVIYFPRGPRRFYLPTGNHAWFVLSVKSAHLLPLSRRFETLGQFMSQISRTPGAMQLLTVGHITKSVRATIHGICINKQESPEWELALGIYARTLISTLANGLRKVPAVAPAAVNPETLKSFIEEHLDSTLTIHKIARAFALSDTAVKRLFRKLLDTTVHGYIIEQRLVLAKQLLLTTSDSIYFIAMRTGFSDPSHFVKCFKKKYIITPAAFRKQGGE